MSTVETVRGPVALDLLGPTLMHEHVFVASPEARECFGSLWDEPLWDEEVRVADAIAKLRRLREAGIETIVDPTVYGLGRNVERLGRINAEVDLNIIVASGIYAFLELPGFLGMRSDAQVIEMFTREITEGINGTGVRAAFLKCTLERSGLIGDVPRILSIIAATAQATGVPVMIHTNAEAETGRLALDRFAAAGVDPARIVVAHAGDSNDLAYLRALADRGAWLGLDRWGIEHFNPFEDRLRTLLALIAEGYADRIHLSHDGACFYDFMFANPPFADEHPDYLLISHRVLPALREAGVGEATIEQLMVDNPRRFFTR
jgi:phosphotriesterase-related protein